MVHRGFDEGASSGWRRMVWVAALWPGLAIAVAVADSSGSTSTDGAARPIADTATAAGGDDAGQHEPFAELNAALAAARAKLEQLTEAAAVATVAGELRTALQAAKQENEQLTRELEAARAAVDGARVRLEASAEALAEKDAALQELTQREEALAAAAEDHGERIAGLRAALEASEAKVAAAERARDDAEARARAAERTLRRALDETAALQDRIAGLEARLAPMREALAAAERERDAAKAEAGELRAEAERLGQALASARAEATRLRADNADIQARMAQLREAADSATAAARETLLAMENKIAGLNAAFADVSPAAGAAPAAAGREDADERREPPRVRSARASQPTVTAPLPGPIPPPARAEAVPAAARKVPPPDADDAHAADLAAVKATPDDAGSMALARVTAALPLEERMQARNLLADLRAETRSRGLLLTVPGELLFKVDSDRVEPAAHEALAKVAEVIDLYGDKDVLITGHTDAIGDAAYNKQLSQRRAELVKAFFVDNFGVPARRLYTRGHGEEQPIASNATRDGRQANRRVEVLILD